MHFWKFIDSWLLPCWFLYESLLELNVLELHCPRKMWYALNMETSMTFDEMNNMYTKAFKNDCSRLCFTNAFVKQLKISLHLILKSSNQPVNHSPQVKKWEILRAVEHMKFRRVLNSPQNFSFMRMHVYCFQKWRQTSLSHLIYIFSHSFSPSQSLSYTRSSWSTFLLVLQHM